MPKHKHKQPLRKGRISTVTEPVVLSPDSKHLYLIHINVSLYADNEQDPWADPPDVVDPWYRYWIKPLVKDRDIMIAGYGGEWKWETARLSELERVIADLEERDYAEGEKRDCYGFTCDDCSSWCHGVE